MQAAIYRYSTTICQILLSKKLFRENTEGIVPIYAKLKGMFSIDF